MSIKRQFIAGAKCPECGAEDKIQRCQTDERMWMHCLACGMDRNMDDNSAEEPPTQKDTTEAQPVIWKSL